MKPTVGDEAPDFTAELIGPSGADGGTLTLSDLRGETVVLMFYPRDNTPGCTLQACALRDHWDGLKNRARIFGVSTDSVESHRKFSAKRQLPYPLIVDSERQIVAAYGVWVSKSFLGKQFFGTERSSFVIGPDGRIAAVLEKVSPLKHRELLDQALA
jgi:thioredoxin-dependent peroxiredoxin